MSTIQNAFLKFYHSYEKAYTSNAQQYKASKNIMTCKTADMGGHVFKCEECGHINVCYNS